MKIYGLQKLTLLDFPGKVACTVFTGGCNLRCPFCHNASLVLDAATSELIAEEEWSAFLQKRRGVIDGVCVSGGEPLLQADIANFLYQVKSLGYSIKLDTNGCFPERLKELVDEGLIDYVAMDIKSAPALYGAAVGVSDFDFSKVAKSIEFLLNGQLDYEFRTTVVKGLHDETSLRSAAAAITGAKRYYLQKFADSGDLIGSGFTAFADDEMKMFLDAVSPFVNFAALRGV